MKGSLLNYSTSIDAGKTAMEIVGLLAAHRCLHINLETDGLGVFTGITFGIMVGQKEQGFRLPVNAEAVLDALRANNRQGKVQPRFVNKEQASKVAWRIVKDWVEAQIAIIESGMATTAEVFLPYLITDTNQTLYERLSERSFALLSAPAGAQSVV